jgi:hypothetical protein
MHCSECSEPLENDDLDVDLVNIEVCSGACAAKKYRASKKLASSYLEALRKIIALGDNKESREGLGVYYTLGSMIGVARSATFGFFGYVPETTEERRAA